MQNFVTVKIGNGEERREIKCFEYVEMSCLRQCLKPGACWQPPSISLPVPLLYPGEKFFRCVDGSIVIVKETN